MQRRWIFALALTAPLALVGLFSKADLPPPKNADDGRPMAADEFCDAQIRYETTPQISKAYIDADGVRHIVLDPMLRADEQRTHRTFLIAHECAHHFLKHTSRAGLARRNTKRHAIRDQELSADCWAAEQMVARGMRDELYTLSDEFFRRGFVSPGGGYPAGIQRSNIIRHCIHLAMQHPSGAAAEAADPDSLN